ncbi:MAG: hypothetical protein A2V66_15375 [Ignavibacteria bacterium RBG_13_36_8]|nr:MAG: hypothetical protein A2V66_15375 [Ignavibacteria bacterium RBG_13_36_8]
MNTLSYYVKSKAEEFGYKFIHVHPSDVNFQIKLKELTDNEIGIVMYPSRYSVLSEGARFNGRIIYEGQIIEIIKKSEKKVAGGTEEEPIYTTTRAKLNETYQQKLDNRLTDMQTILNTFMYSLFDCAKTMKVSLLIVNDFVNKYNEGVDGLSMQVTVELW